MTTRLHRPGSHILTVAATATALALAGCGTQPPPAPPAAPTVPTATAEPAEQVIAWTDSICGAIIPVAESLLNPPGFDVTAPAATQDAYLSYVTRAQSATDKALEDVAAAGAAPVDDGQQVADEVREQLTDLRDDLSDARTQLQQADPNDASSIGRSVVAAGNVVGAVGNSAQALSALDGNPRLDTAFDQAQSCQRLRSIQTPGDTAPR